MSIKYWVEKTLVSGRNDRLNGPNSLGKALWSPQKSKDGKDIYHSMREIKPNDVVFHFIDNTALVGVSRVRSSADTNFTGLSGTDWSNTPSYRIELDGFTKLMVPIDRKEFLQEPLFREPLSKILNDNKGLFFNKNFELNQGAYITEAPIELIKIWDKIYKRKSNGNTLPFFEKEVEEEPMVEKTVSNSIMQIISIPKPFLLLAGISGTGKTRFVREQAKASAGLHNMAEGENFCLVPVRPDWHEPSDLLGYISRIGNGGPRYVVTDLLQFIVATWKHAALSASVTNVTYRQLDNICPFWLCLDEMNLAPVEQYFADYLSILETRKWEDGAYSCGPLLKPAVIQQQLDDSGRVELWEKLNVAGDDPLSAQLREYFTATGIPLPPNLIVAGTVNMDETTHGFSRKVIDRALTIDFGEFFPNDYGQFFLPVNRPKALGFPVLSQIAKDDLPAVTADPDGLKTIAFLEAVNGILKETPFELAYRALNEALLAVVCFSPSDGIQLQAVWDDFLMMKVLPRIEGDAEKLSYDGETSLLTRLSDTLKENLPDVWVGERPDLLSEKAGDGAAVMTFCRSKKKLEWMQNRLAANAFTTFWP